jgi:Haloacid dehalogenase-like hydrolase
MSDPVRMDCGTSGEALRRLRQIEGFVFDMDGTLVLGDRQNQGLRALPGAVELTQALDRRGIPFAVFTNATTRPPAKYAQILRALGIPAPDSNLLTPASAAVTHFTDVGHRRVMVLGRRRHGGALAGSRFGGGGTGARLWRGCGAGRLVPRGDLRRPGSRLRRSSARGPASTAAPHPGSSPPRPAGRWAPHGSSAPRCTTPPACRWRSSESHRATPQTPRPADSASTPTESRWSETTPNWKSRWLVPAGRLRSLSARDYTSRGTSRRCRPSNDRT